MEIFYVKNKLLIYRTPLENHLIKRKIKNSLKDFLETLMLEEYNMKTNQ